MSHRLLLSGIVAIGVVATAMASAGAQPFSETAAGVAVRDAGALAARIRGYHRWTGSTPPPPSYCPTMRAGEATSVVLARLANQAIRYRQPGLALELQRMADPQRCTRRRRGDVSYSIYPCPVAQSSHPARAIILPFV